ncbi:protein Gawky-like isoform X4 [Penaeus indicus]|uniref:protein Gawky-like isoform X4 n=1 Tax=Penaeus indicus TaxID=29960 RepID=UPI00300D276D
MLHVEVTTNYLAQKQDHRINNSKPICDPNPLLSCQDVLSVPSSGDLGFYALSAKECVDDCLVSPLSVSSSGSSDTEAFSLIVKCCVGGGLCIRMDSHCEAHQANTVTNLPNPEFPTNKVPDTSTDVETFGMVCEAQSERDVDHKSSSSQSILSVDDTAEVAANETSNVPVSSAGRESPVTDGGADGARADPYLPPQPVKSLSVIFSSTPLHGHFSTASPHISSGDEEPQGTSGPSRPSSTTAPGSPGLGGSLRGMPITPSGQQGVVKTVAASSQCCVGEAEASCTTHVLHNTSQPAQQPVAAVAQAAAHTQASLNIPGSMANNNANSQLQGSNPSFNQETKQAIASLLQISATCNQYASFPTSSKFQAAGKPGKFGFASFPHGFIKVNRWGIPRGLGLVGGGESAANGWGTSAPQTAGWGSSGANQAGSQGQWGGAPNRAGGAPNTSPGQGGSLKPAQQNSGPSQQPSSPAGQQNTQTGGTGGQQGPAGVNNQQQTQQGNSGQGGNSNNTWAQAAGKGLPAGSGSGDAQKRHMEQQLQSIREALLSSEGWGGENVNQETTWDLPGSPEPCKDANAPHLKLNVNNGCDLWENNLRNGGAAPPKTQQAPWGHTPATNYGGTWGEDDDATDSSNVWTGVPSNNPQWGANTPNPPNMWGGGAPPKKNSEWAAGGSGTGGGNTQSGWGDHGPQRSGVENPPSEWGPGGPHKPGPHVGQHAGPHSHSGPHSGPSSGPHSGSHGGLHSGHHVVPHSGPHSTPHGAPHNGPHSGSHTGPHGPHGPHNGPHGVPHGAPHGNLTHSGPPGGPGGPTQWNGPKDMKPSGPVGAPSGWEEPSPPTQRRDDGTAVWGNPQQQANVSRWKEMPNPNMMGRPNMPGPQQGRMPGPPVPPGIKPDQRMWGQHGRNGSWSDPPHDTGSGMWGEEPKSGGWGEPPITSPSWGTKPKTPTGGPVGPGWGETDMELQGWGHQNKVPKGLSKEIIYNSKQFRTLLEMGFKKEDIEAALRNNNMGLDDTLMELSNRGIAGMGGSSAGDAWRNPPLEEHAPFDLTNPNFQQRFPPAPHHLPFTNQQGSSGNSPHVRALMQHIQMAVQAGYLNPQILNQPLAPTTLMLLNNMLSHINMLQKFTQQQAIWQAQAHINKNSSQTLLSLNVSITKTKQQIQNLQNQIAAQQALYVKQQQQHQHHHQQLNSHITGGPPGTQNDFFNKPSLPDQLCSSFDFLALNNNPAIINVGQQQGSRLHQWKLPSLENDESDFIRAPGAPGKPSMPQSQSSPNLTPLLGPSNSTWSLNRTSESGWPESSSGGSVDVANNPGVEKVVPNMDSRWVASSQANASGSYGLDIKPFEPGKPWMMKNIEDDPNITPGSVTQSPLALGIKESVDLLSSISKTSTTNTASDMAGPLTSFSLTSNTWSFNPGPGHHAANSPLSGDNKLSSGTNGKSGSAWNESSQGGSNNLASELWGAPGNKLRGPPPGMSVGSSNNKIGVGVSGGSWGALGRSTSWSGEQQRNPPNSALHSAAVVAASGAWTNSQLPSQLPSTWLILRNLTPQIDGSTLKTLCMQHGPLVNFYLSLNHGFALVNYGSREEAAKAQGNLNNCLLSNTTILAEFANDSEVKQVMGQPTHQGQAAPPTPGPTNASSWGGSGRGSTPTSQSSGGSKVDSWGNGNSSNLWSSGPGGSSSLWSGANIGEGDPHRATPSSLKPYLPDGLLTSESM